MSAGAVDRKELRPLFAGSGHGATHELASARRPALLEPVDQHLHRDPRLDRRQHVAGAPPRRQAAPRAAGGTGEDDAPAHEKSSSGVSELAEVAASMHNPGHFDTARPRSCPTGSLGRLDVLSRLREHLGCGHGSAFIELRKAFSHGSPQGLLRLEQPQALGEHIAFGEKSPLSDESLHESRQVGGDFHGQGLVTPSGVLPCWLS